MIRRRPTIGSPAAIAKERSDHQDEAQARAEMESRLQSLHQEVLGGRRGDEYLDDTLHACNFWKAIATPEEEGQRRHALRVLYHLGALTPENTLAIARFIVRLTTGLAEKERAIRVGPSGTDPQEA